MTKDSKIKMQFEFIVELTEDMTLEKMDKIQKSVDKFLNSNDVSKKEIRSIGETFAVYASIFLSANEKRNKIEYKKSKKDFYTVH